MHSARIAGPAQNASCAQFENASRHGHETVWALLLGALNSAAHRARAHNAHMARAARSKYSRSCHIWRFFRGNIAARGRDALALARASRSRTQDINALAPSWTLIAFSRAAHSTGRSHLRAACANQRRFGRGRTNASRIISRNNALLFGITRTRAKHVRGSSPRWTTHHALATHLRNRVLVCITQTARTAFGHRVLLRASSLWRWAPRPAGRINNISLAFLAVFVAQRITLDLAPPRI